MIALQNRNYLLAPVSLAILFASACSKENKVDQSQRNSYAIDQNTNDALPGPDGLILQLTRGSVAAPVTIELNEASPDEYPSTTAYEVKGKVYAFLPHNFTFEHPILIQLPAAGGSGAITAEPGGNWSTAQAAQSGLFVQIQTDHFSYYAVTGSERPNTTPDGGDVKIDSGSLGGSGTGGTGTGGMPCMTTGEQPAGSADAMGSLAHELVPSGVPFTAKDGYAVYKKTMMRGPLSTMYNTTLAITFTDYTMACSVALATGQDGMEPRGGKADSKVLNVKMEWNSNAAQPEVMPMVYDSTSKDFRLDFTFAGLDGQCRPEMAFSPPGNSSVTVTAFDATHIEGTLTVMGGGGGGGMMDTFSGSFNFPICNLPDQPGAMCCLP